MIVIRTEIECQNGHKNAWITKFSGGRIISQEYEEETCSCPKWDFGEGFVPCGEEYVIEGNRGV